MRPALRHAILMILLVAFLLPGLAQARPVSSSPARAAAMGEVTQNTGFFNVVWNLLTNLLSGSPIMAKDESATTPPPSTTTTSTDPVDNGGHLDPLG
jgi:hypothetical protein